MPPISKKQAADREYMRTQFPLMNLMKDLSSKQVQVLLPYLKSSTHEGLCCSVYNALGNHATFTESQVEGLKTALLPKLANYEYLSEKRNTKSPKVLAKRAEKLIQSGEGFPAILAAVVPLLANLLSK